MMQCFLQLLQNMEKQTFICNAIEDGWTVKKRKGKYYFMKKHGGKKDFFSEAFLSEFIVKYLNLLPDPKVAELA